MSLKFTVWKQPSDPTSNGLQASRFYYHGTNGGNVTVPCSEADGFATEKEAHRAVTKVWRSFCRALGIKEFPNEPYTRDSLRPARLEASKKF